jgi:hypothetical protein
MVCFEHPILSGSAWSPLDGECSGARRRTAPPQVMITVLKTFLRVSNISGNGRFGPNRHLKYLIACVVQNSDMVVIELGSIDTDLGRNKLCLGNRAIVITTIQP